MAIISIATEWASDLKTGYCKAGWWLNQKFCCWEMMDPAGPGGAVVPHAAAAKASIAAAAANGAATATATTTVASSIATATNSGLNNVTNRALDFATNPSFSHARRAVEMMSSYHARAASPQGSDLAETCADWVPWSSWTLPAWIIYILFAAALSAACAHLVRAFAPYAAGSGITEIKCILAGFIINGFLGPVTLFIKSLSLPLAIASGLSVGKEGPAVHVACCIGNVVAGWFKSFDRSQARMRELLTAASAAGVAVAFGSPIGGVLFSLEEMAYQFPATTMWRSFLCALAATVTLSFMNPFRTGKLVLFQVSYDRDWHYFEMIFYIIIGIFGGLYGAMIIKYNLQVQAFRRANLAAYGVSEAVTLAVITAFIGYWNKFLRIDMSESLEILFRECEGGGDYDNLCQTWAQWRMVNSLLLATVLRAVLVVLSYGCKVPAGIFVPSMAIGATFGRMLGILVKAMYNTFPNAAIFSACQPDVPCITPGTYAFLGAAAALAGVTRITVAVVVIMFELTGALTYILPTMIVVMITKGVGDMYGKGGIAEQTMKFAGYPFLDKDEHNFGLLPVQEVMKKDPDVVYAEGMQLRDLELRLRNTYRGFPVVRSETDSTLLGYVGKTELRYALGKAKRARSSLAADTVCYFTTADVNGQDGDTTAHRQSKGNGEELAHSQEEAEARAEQRQSQQQSRLRSAEQQGLIPDVDVGEDDEEADEEIDGIHGVNLGGVDGEGDEDTLELGQWVDQTPLTVAPAMALEVVMDLFKKMGPRVILVTSRQGSLRGLVTVKDLLKHIAAQEHADSVAREAARAAREEGNAGILPEWVTDAGVDGERFGGELEQVLSEGWHWIKERVDTWRLPRAGNGRATSRRSAAGESREQGGDYAELRERGSRPSSVLYDGAEEEQNEAGRGQRSDPSGAGHRSVEGDQFVIE